METREKPIRSTKLNLLPLWGSYVHIKIHWVAQQGALASRIEYQHLPPGDERHSVRYTHSAGRETGTGQPDTDLRTYRLTRRVHSRQVFEADGPGVQVSALLTGGSG